MNKLAVAVLGAALVAGGVYLTTHGESGAWLYFGAFLCLVELL